MSQERPKVLVGCTGSVASVKVPVLLNALSSLPCGVSQTSEIFHWNFLYMYSFWILSMFQDVTVSGSECVYMHGNF